MNDDLRRMILSSASSLGISPVDLATVISYETGGTFDPEKRGPTTKWGTHRGLIQWGEPQADKYLGGDFSIPKQGEGIVAYMRDHGVEPGMGLLDVYSAVNAGGVGPDYHSRSDAHAGGAPGTVRDKVENQMAGHRRKAEALVGNELNLSPEARDFVINNPQPGGFGPEVENAVFGTMAPTLLDPMTASAGPAQFGMTDIDPAAAGLAFGEDKGSPLANFFTELGKMDMPSAPRLGPMSGPSEHQTNALTNVLKNPSFGELMMRRRYMGA